MHIVVQPLPSVDPPIIPRVSALPPHLIVGPVSLVHCGIRPFINSVTVFLALGVLPNKVRPVFPFFLALPAVDIVLPLANISLGC